MDENLDLTKILKNAPKGTRLWSPICGDCILDKIKTTDNYTIYCLDISHHTPVRFTSDGKYTLCFNDGECVLFPSKDNRDWQKFEVTKKHKEFKPFQKVLRRTRDGNDNVIWTADFYSHYDESSMKHFFTSGYMANDSIIIPYEGNEDKLGKPVE